MENSFDSVDHFIPEIVTKTSTYFLTLDQNKIKQNLVQWDLKRVNANRQSFTVDNDGRSHDATCRKTMGVNYMLNHICYLKVFL